jgi:hypothetical protein
MKNLIVLILLLCSANAFSQNDSIEKSILLHRLNTGAITEMDFNRLLTRWVQASEKTGGYPDLPINQTNQVHFIFVQDFPDIEKEVLVRRTLEWLAINYGIIPAYLYSHEGDGKIIFSNQYNIDNTYTCNYTAVVTVKDGKMLLEFLKISLSRQMEWGTSTTAIEKCYPVINKRFQEWEAGVSVLKKTNDFFYSELASLTEFILNYDASYSF